ncbi:MAG: hypothetical protein HY892_09940, partial [Deltaproteobacteria bacterium]|nr:hypothetical protein [Deltaproteobacteria bacterium]
RHFYSALVFVANKAFIDGLSPQERKVITDSAHAAALQGRRFIRGNEAKQLADLKAAGMQVEDKPDFAAFRKATAPVVNSASGETKKLLEQIEQTVK